MLRASLRYRSNSFHLFDRFWRSELWPHDICQGATAVPHDRQENFIPNRKRFFRNFPPHADSPSGKACGLPEGTLRNTRPSASDSPSLVAPEGRSLLLALGQSLWLARGYAREYSAFGLGFTFASRAWEVVLSSSSPSFQTIKEPAPIKRLPCVRGAVTAKP